MFAVLCTMPSYAKQFDFFNNNNNTIVTVISVEYVQHYNVSA